jgi:hypothetical protein
MSYPRTQKRVVCKWRTTVVAFEPFLKRIVDDHVSLALCMRSATRANINKIGKALMHLMACRDHPKLNVERCIQYSIATYTPNSSPK